MVFAKSVEVGSICLFFRCEKGNVFIYNTYPTILLMRIFVFCFFLKLQVGQYILCRMFFSVHLLTNKPGGLKDLPKAHS